jgi:glutathione S-transferase
MAEIKSESVADLLRICASRIFLAEKGITVPTVHVDLRAGEQFTPEFRAINPECTVPVLEFGDGRRIAEVIAICLYFELAHPKPALMGVGAQDRAIDAPSRPP